MCRDNYKYRIAENVDGRKLWRIWQFATNSPKKFYPPIAEKAIEARLKFAKVFFTKCNLACNSPKFSPAKIFRYTVLQILLTLCQAT